MRKLAPDWGPGRAAVNSARGPLPSVPCQALALVVHSAAEFPGVARQGNAQPQPGAARGRKPQQQRAERPAQGEMQQRVEGEVEDVAHPSQHGHEPHVRKDLGNQERGRRHHAPHRQEQRPQLDDILRSGTGRIWVSYSLDYRASKKATFLVADRETNAPVETV